MDEKEGFVADLMNKAFDLEAPEMPDFEQIKDENEILELDFEQLEHLNAAGAMELQIIKDQHQSR